MNWLKWYQRTCSDPKLRMVARNSGQPLMHVISVWALTLELASESEDRGSVEGIQEGVMDFTLDAFDGMSKSILDEMKKIGMISNGRVTAWEKRQATGGAKNDYSTPRVKKHRESLKSERLQPDELGVQDFSIHGETPIDKIREEKNRKKEQRASALELSFDRFWVEYPRKEAKADALRAWKKLAPNDALVDAIIAGAVRYRESENWAAKGKNYIKLAGGWLRDERWADEATEVAATSSTPDWLKGIIARA